MEKRNCQNCKKDFVIDQEDFSFYEKIKVPPPTFCYLCRAQRRFAFRNDRALYKRKSDFSGEDIFSTYPTTVPFPVYTNAEWFSDNWDPMEHGKEYDFSKSFFQQFKELSEKVPRPAQSAYRLENCTYSNNIGDAKNCYMVFNATFDEDCAYCSSIDFSKMCFDCSHAIHRLEIGYESFNSASSSKIFFSENVSYSFDIFFSKNLKGCNDCFGCANLNKKSYCIFNEQYTRESYFEKLKEFDLGSYKSLCEIKERAKKFWLKFPNKFRQDGSKSIDVSGDYIYHSKNTHKTYIAVEAEDVKYCQYISEPPIKDTYDLTVFGANANLCYEDAIVGDQAYNVKFSIQTYTNVRDMDYCEYCTSGSNLFGCVGLRSKKFCILNRQYSENEYYALKEKIIEHMKSVPYTSPQGHIYTYGEFFPPHFSYFGYDETIAQEHFPLTKEGAIAKGYHWSDSSPNKYNITLRAEDILDNIQNIEKNIINEVIECADKSNCEHNCPGAFRIIASEFDFYKKYSLAIPRKCPNCRHYERLEKRNSVFLYNRTCQCAGKFDSSETYKNEVEHFHGKDRCGSSIETAFSPERPEIIYCEKCYQKEVI